MLYEKIQTLAGKRGLSINQMENDLGFSSSYLSKLRHSMPSARNLKKIADYLGVTMDDLLEGGTSDDDRTAD